MGYKDYKGLDAVNYFRPAITLGEMDDFKNLVEQCHKEDLKIIAFLNLGYCAWEHPYFIQACKDVGQGIRSEETEMFIWSDCKKPVATDLNAPWFMGYAHGIWEYSETAKKYYWSKWAGDKTGRNLPQFNFDSIRWQKECHNIIRFWLDTGLDGLIIDAVNWYTNCNWDTNYSTIIKPAYQNGKVYLQPEGGGGFRDDPVPWIEKGMFNSVQDYAINLWWEGRDVIGRALETGNPSGIEPVIAGYRDRVVMAGGVTYACPNWNRDSTPDERLLELALLIGAGELIQLPSDVLDLQWPENKLETLISLLTLQRKTPALFPSANRIRLHTQNNNCYYAIFRISSDEEQQYLAIYNFTREVGLVEVTLPDGIAIQKQIPALGYLFEALH